MTAIQFDSFLPKKGKKVFMATGSIVIGNTELQDDASVWFNTVIRGDNDKITIGTGSNIQDNSVLHCDKGVPLTIGKNVTIGHNAIVHGCTIEDDVLIGMGAIIMNNAVIKSGSIIAAGSVVLENTVIPPFSLAAGSPCKIKKTFDESIINVIRKSAFHYVELKDRYIELLETQKL